MQLLSSFLKSTRRMSQQVDRGGSGDLDIEEIGTKRRNGSKREFLRSLLRKSDGQSRARMRQSVQSAPAKLRKESSKSSEKPPSPTVDPDKPLPPPPPAASTALPEPIVKPAKDLKRTTTPIGIPGLHKLFSGAPQFFARSEGHHTGAPYPSVAFPWDTDVDVRDLSDHVQIQDGAWSCVTAWPHITRDISVDSTNVNIHEQKHKALFVPRCRERPNMLSMQGLEKGSIGFQAALEIGVADALIVAKEETVEALQFRSESRRKFLTGKAGLRPVGDSVLIERLTNLSTIYQDNTAIPQRHAVELYTELFTQVLFPPSRVTDADDPYSLRVQVEALVNVLKNPVVWIDFSLVEWRIRLGNLLWGPLMEKMTEDEVAATSEVNNDPGTEKYWLLLQILLSCELLVRLDLLSAEPHGTTLQDMQQFDKNATTSVKWSLILARQWLENIRIEKISNSSETEKLPAGWLSTFTNPAIVKPPIHQGIDGVRFLGRHQTRQLSGLLHFANKLKWPNLESLTAKVAVNGIPVSDSTHSTPVIGTPLSISTQRSSSYFSSGRPRVRRRLSTQQRNSTIMQPPGWLSNSYISNLVLPGESLSHFLISTLLESDEAAIARLGEETNLYCGFSYEGRSFWSTACIVGRVLAAGTGASDCMGWIVSDIVPNGPAGWVDINVQRNEANVKHGDARIWKKKNIEHNGDVIGGAQADSVLPEDFSLPLDEPSHQRFSVVFDALDLSPAGTPRDSNSTEEPREEPRSSVVEDGEEYNIQTNSATMRFSIISEGEGKEIELPLKYDVYFVTAHACVPSRRTELLKMSTNYSKEINGDVVSSTRERHAGMEQFIHASESLRNQYGEANLNTGHPLHKRFSYMKTTLSDLLSGPTRLSLSGLLDPPASPGSTPVDSKQEGQADSIPRVLVVDCTSFIAETSVPPQSRHSQGSNLEMLARAYCAERGWNALISRGGRGCLACSIREAGALGWRVVLRFE